VIEKPNAVMIGLERSTGGAPLTQPDQIRAHLLFAQFVRRPPVVGCQPANRLDVNLLAPGCQPRQVHVLDHSASQWGHRHLPSFQDRLGPTGPTGRRDTLNCSNQRCRAPPRRSRSVQYREFHRLRPRERRSEAENAIRINCLRIKFPTRRNRELIWTYQGIKSRYQGKSPLHQGTDNPNSFPGNKKGDGTLEHGLRTSRARTGHSAGYERRWERASPA
jgi:hypothetical protein